MEDETVASEIQPAQQNIVRKTYLFRIRKRFDYAQAFTVKKKIEERAAPLKGVAAFLQPLITRLKK